MAIQSDLRSEERKVAPQPMCASGATDIGLQRQQNQDTFVSPISIRARISSPCAEVRALPLRPRFSPLGLRRHGGRRPPAKWLRKSRRASIARNPSKKARRSHSIQPRRFTRGDLANRAILDESRCGGRAGHGDDLHRRRS